VNPAPEATGLLNETNRKFLTAALIVLIALVIVVAWLLPTLRHHLAVDRCLDAGGAYEHRQDRCILPTR